jgi:RNA polymerase primary sigma factor
MVIDLDQSSEPGFKIYLKEIGTLPVLSTREELALAARIRRGDAAARNQMIKASLRLVVKIAHDYANRGVPLLDLIIEGTSGLIRAIERFDPRKDGQLSTCAAQGIKRSIQRALAGQAKGNRLPENPSTGSARRNESV